MMSSCNPACYIRGLFHGIGRGVPNDFHRQLGTVGFYLVANELLNGKYIVDTLQR